MSFNLPRNARDLRFSGELRAALEEDAPRLGKRRLRQAPSIPPKDAYDADPIPTPYFGQPSPVGSEDHDDCPTTMMDRETIPHAPPQKQLKTQVIPGFRKMTPSDSGTPNVIISLPAEAKKRSSPPLAFWLIASLVLAIASYRIAPAAVAHAKAMTTLLDGSSSE